MLSLPNEIHEQFPLSNHEKCPDIELIFKLRKQQQQFYRFEGFSHSLKKNLIWVAMILRSGLKLPSLGLVTKMLPCVSRRSFVRSKWVSACKVIRRIPGTRQVSKKTGSHFTLIIIIITWKTTRSLPILQSLRQCAAPENSQWYWILSSEFSDCFTQLNTWS